MFSECSNEDKANPGNQYFFAPKRPSNHQCYLFIGCYLKKRSGICAELQKGKYKLERSSGLKLKWK